MPSVESWSPITQMEVVKSIWHKLRVHLENEKTQIYETIGHYPAPIAACDQQFNYLLEEQTRIWHELARLDQARDESLTVGDAIQRIDEFIRSSSYVDAETEQITRSYLQERLSQIQC